ncbi:hypothetical protein IFM89_004976 [Coptis chinensis]|uniref:Small multi-drug export protein n=1 Tax=Coptis chinensis TaxID=261450 RepID=A0A835LR03_9MAGN|nr:hypothetical protein IFM89_004976 [Coptis chinensis]
MSSITTSLSPSTFIFTKPQQRKNPLTLIPSIFSHHLLSKFQPLSKAKPFQTHSFIQNAKRTSVALTIIEDNDENNEILNFFDEEQKEQVGPIKFVLLVLVWASVSLVASAFIGNNNAHAVVSGASDSIRASSFGVKVASALRGSGWPDEAVVFVLATLPVVELRGAIPVGYWLQLKPVLLTVLAVLGNMVPVPLIILNLKRFASLLAQSNPSASRFLDLLFKRAKEKAGPIEEFQWLGLMLFVAVPFPGTGAWTGAIIASILDMPFWSAVSANFFGVVLAGLLVNLLVNLGLKYAIVTGVVLFLISTFMWNVLRSLKKSLSSSN